MAHAVQSRWIPWANSKMCCVFPGGGNPMDERIALFMPSLAGGGAEKVMLNLGRGMLARGIEVDLVLVSAEGPYLADVPQGINLVDLRARRVLTSLPGLMEYLKERRPKVLLSAQNHANIIALWARRLSGAKCLQQSRSRSLNRWAGFPWERPPSPDKPVQGHNRREPERSGPRSPRPWPPGRGPGRSP